MPRTTDVRKYPPEYHAMMQSALSRPVIINDPAPAGLRGHIQAFFRACEAAGGPLAEQAARLQAVSSPGDPSDPDVRKRTPHVAVMLRSDSVYARRVAAALGSSVADKAAELQANLAAQLGGRNGIA